MTPRGRGTSIDSLKRAAIPCLLFAASTAAFAQAAPNVTEPQGINLGVTSFFDGFSGPPGFSYLGVLRYTRGTFDFRAFFRLEYVKAGAGLPHGPI